MKTRYVFIRYRDYFDSLAGPEGPAWAEFSLYDTPCPPDPFRDPFFHLDCYNLRYMESEEIPDSYPASMVSRVQQSHAAFRNGAGAYMADLLFCPSGAAHYFGRPLPAGKTLLTLDLAGEKPCYAYLYLRETAPLTPDVLCSHLERLSGALFGDERHYEIGNR